MTIHWCGTGLSAIPGLRRLIEGGHAVVVWNRTVEKAREAVGDLTDDIRAFDLDALCDVLQPDDVAISMLPAAWHVKPAELCISKTAHFVSSSYIAPEMKALDHAAKQAGVALVNEVGLDPGIDHVMAHWMVADYRASAAYNAKNTLSFIAYCGGVPKHPNAFRYKFSWSPLGVLKALRSPSRSIRDFVELEVARPWDAITSYAAPLAVPESFEVYPNRDSLPFMEDYGFDEAWTVKEFVRGTLRLDGWADAWAEVFREIETLEGPAGDKRLKEMSDQLWAENAYDEDEPDRVILCVALKAEKDGVPVYHKTYSLDAWGDRRGTAMARLVSVPVSLAVEAVLNREFSPGVHAAPSDPKLVARWMDAVDTQAQHLQIVDHLG
ncbi:MAG: saccharopine dehydrogenase C-terminal domain-containing protein [Planctomycetota bacterium]|jgi:saccharopine dehydrogenase (NADP+, L-glutamate forming)